MDAAFDASAGDVTIEVRRAAAIVGLNRPARLNALTDEMRAEVRAALPRFAKDPMVYAMAIKSTATGPFSAGGDVREIVAHLPQDPERAAQSFADEYRMNWMLECFPKPTVALINGFVAGSGVGLTAYATHRVAGPDYQFAMPETAIGLFPDVGVAAKLAELPSEIGTYLGLTGVTIGRADAHALGLVTHAVPAAALAKIEEALVDAEPVDALLDSWAEAPEPSGLIARGDFIAELFAGDDLRAIIARLERCAAGSGDAADWAGQTLALLRTRAPLSLFVTLRHLRTAARVDIRQTLIIDYQLAVRFLADPDFPEGVRAMLIDKDRAPRWNPADIAEVRDQDVDAYFQEAPSARLDLPERDEMQRSLTAI